MEPVSFDGVTLTDEYTVLSVRGIASPTVQKIEVEGRDGVVPRGVVYGCPPVTLTVIADGDRLALARQMRELASIFAVDSPRKLQFGDDDGLYYMAQPDGPLDWRQFANTGKLVVPMLVPSPARYGEAKSFTVPSGGSVTFTVGGTYPTRPRISTSSAVRNSGSLVWGLTLDNADFLKVATGSSSSRAVVIDCEARTCLVASSATLPTKESDWFELKPGSHTIANSDGSGAATVKFTERWL